MKILRDSPNRMITKLLDLVGIPLRYVDKAMEAMGKDSQESTEFSRKALDPMRQAYRARFTPGPEFLDYVQAQYEALDVPGPKQLQDINFRLPGSVVP